MRIERERGGHDVCDFREAMRRGCWGCSGDDVERSCSWTGPVGSSVDTNGVFGSRFSSVSVGGAAVNEYKESSWLSVMVRIWGFAYATALKAPLIEAGCL